VSRGKGMPEAGSGHGDGGGHGNGGGGKGTGGGWSGDQGRRVVRALTASGASILILAFIAFGASFPLPGAPPEEGLLRLDWRLRGEEAGGCLRPTEAELERLPPHMRNPDACAGGLPPYRLSVRVDGGLVLDRVVRGGGVRGDRPLTVYDEVPLALGLRRIRIDFEPADEMGPPAATVAGDGLRLSTEGTVEIEAGRVLLAVRRQDTGELVLRPPVP
jgi:hypothetical protein